MNRHNTTYSILSSGQHTVFFRRYRDKGVTVMSRCVAATEGNVILMHSGCMVDAVKDGIERMRKHGNKPWVDRFKKRTKNQNNPDSRTGNDPGPSGGNPGSSGGSGGGTRSRPLAKKGETDKAKRAADFNIQVSANV
jgi:hypothetical protein